MYGGIFKNKPTFQRIREVLPKFLCWKGVAGAGGSIHDPGGRKVVYYTFEFGNVSNNLT
jgi:hypothetical protein